MSKQTKNLEICQKALSLKTFIEESFITLGQYLHDIKENRRYEANWSSWDEFKAELKMSNNSVDKLIQIYKTFILDYKIGPEEVITAGGWSVIAELLPVIENKEQAKEWLKKAEALTREDLRKEITEHKTGKPMQQCKHKNTYTIVVCRDCGIRMEEHKDHD